jgi:GAF domain-containing protein
MSNRAESAKLNWPRWAEVLLIAVLVVIVCNRSASLLDGAAYRAGLYGELVYAGGRAVNDPAAPLGFGKMVDVVPDGPFARAGVRNGDHVRTDPVYFRQQNLGFAEKLNFTLNRDGVRSERQITLERVPADSVEAQGSFRRLVNLLAAFVSMLIGCFIIWRGWGNKTAMLLGAALLMLGRGGSGIPGWADQFFAFPMWWILLVGGTTSALLIPFAFRMYEASAGKLPRWHWHLAMVWIVLAALAQAFAASDLFALTNYVVWAGASGLPSLLGAISCLVSVAYLVGGWTKAVAAERTRFAVTIFSLAAYAFASLVAGWDASRTGQLFAFGGREWLVYFNALLLGIIAPGLLAYAVLRHKLFDLGFAVNRTLVFATISAVLLVAFGTLEWAVEHLVPEAWHEGSALFSAGIAVGLFLLFHRIRDGVEHVIERLFFRSWHLNEAALKRFVAAAAHVEKPQALAEQFESELTRFSGGADAKLYTRSGDGAYASAAGETIDADDLALSAMRAEQGPVVPAEVHSPLPAALALPIMHQAALAGFVLLGSKPTGEDYRPDEVEVLGWATQQVGLDLQAIRVRELELSLVKLEARNANLSEVLAKAALPQT